MKKTVVLIATLMFLLAGRASAAERYFLGFKSPGPGMHFTAGLPIIVWADIIPRGENDHQVECYWDDQLAQPRVSAQGNKGPFDYFPLTVPGSMVKPGPHKIRLSSFLKGGDSHEATISVQVDPWPADKKVVELSDDLTATDLDWTKVAVRGHGHVVKVSGKLTIKNSLISDLGALTNIGEPANCVMTAGLTGTLTGDVTITDSIFESTGAVRLTINGNGAVAMRNNEFRASNYVKFVPSDPEASPVISLSGNNATHKLFQGNRIASGRVVFTGMKDWLIGAGEDQNEADGNILMGPRCTIYYERGSKAVVRGNYSYHNYRGRWSQGYNFVFTDSAPDLLIEHNLIQSASWPVQNLAGEFRYNVVLGYGHTWIRTVHNGAIIHHNLFTPDGEGGLGFGIECYLPVKGVKIYNNTFDGGGKTGDFAGGFIGVRDGKIELDSVRNNLFTFARDNQNDSPGLPLVTVSAGQIHYADYNAFYSPDSKQKSNYSPTSVAGKTPGSDGFGGHDVSGSGGGAGQIGIADGRLTASPFAGKRFYPYTVDEAAIWNRQVKLSQVLAEFRARYTPAPGCPIIDKGDPADGPGVDIGAIEAPSGKPRPEDLLGKYGKPGSLPISATTMPALH